MFDLPRRQVALPGKYLCRELPAVLSGHRSGALGPGNNAMLALMVLDDGCGGRIGSGEDEKEGAREQRLDCRPTYVCHAL